jgi:hypothetical protein
MLAYVLLIYDVKMANVGQCPSELWFGPFGAFIST